MSRRSQELAGKYPDGRASKIKARHVTGTLCELFRVLEAQNNEPELVKAMSICSPTGKR